MPIESFLNLTPRPPTPTFFWEVGGGVGGGGGHTATVSAPLTLVGLLLQVLPVPAKPFSNAPSFESCCTVTVSVRPTGDSEDLAPSASRASETILHSPVFSQSSRAATASVPLAAVRVLLKVLPVPAKAISTAPSFVRAVALPLFQCHRRQRRSCSKRFLHRRKYFPIPGSLCLFSGWFALSRSLYHW